MTRDHRWRPLGAARMEGSRASGCSGARGDGRADGRNRMTSGAALCEAAQIRSTPNAGEWAVEHHAALQPSTPVSSLPRARASTSLVRWQPPYPPCAPSLLPACLPPFDVASAPTLKPASSAPPAGYGRVSTCCLLRSATPPGRVRRVHLKSSNSI